ENATQSVVSAQSPAHSSYVRLCLCTRSPPLITCPHMALYPSPPGAVLSPSVHDEDGRVGYSATAESSLRLDWASPAPLTPPIRRQPSSSPKLMPSQRGWKVPQK